MAPCNGRACRYVCRATGWPENDHVKAAGNTQFPAALLLCIAARDFQQACCAPHEGHSPQTTICLIYFTITFLVVPSEYLTMLRPFCALSRRTPLTL